MECQKNLFSLEEGIHYINCAYMSPLLRSVERAGIEGMIRKRNPHTITPRDFFSDGEEVRSLFGRLVNAPAERIALIPSASYALGTVIRNCRAQKGGRIVTVHEEFPSDVLSLHRICHEQGLELITIQPPAELEGRGRIWNERILDAIQPGTVMVNLSSIHWADGTLFDLEAIGKRAKDAGALFVVDGTQSVGALDFDVKKYGVDVLICAGYKWLLGPYTSGCAYFGEYFDGGIPIEETWLNREGSENFRELVNYEPTYREAAARYNMGEYSNFINLPMLKESLRQILEWTPSAIQEYCTRLTQPLLEHLQSNGFIVEEESFRSKHLFGFRLPAHVMLEDLQQRLTANKVIVSLRGSAVRLSPHLYNDERDVDALMDALKV